MRRRPMLQVPPDYIAISTIMDEEPDMRYDERKLTVETVDNHVYFYADVDSDRCLDLMKQVRQIDSQLLQEYLSRDIPEGYQRTPIWLHVQSGGGSLNSALAISDQLSSIKTPVFSIVEGYCMSAATLISMACNRRYIAPNAFMLIHQLSAWSFGTYQQIKDDVEMLDMVMGVLKNFYTEHSRLTMSRIEEILRRDSWFNAKQCLKHGLVDEIKK